MHLIMGEQNAMCEKILSNLEHILSVNPEIHEFAIVPTPEIETNKSPVLYEHNCLGLESWCKKYLLQYTHSTLIKTRKNLLDNLLSIKDKRNINHILIGALLIQPNITTFWNMKRELVTSEILSIQLELNFSKIALSCHSKCNEIFSYRRWLIDSMNSKDTNFNFFDELNVCKASAEKSDNNYHAWNHRIWCLENILHKHFDLENFLISELNFSLEWISRHISENCGFFYRQTLMKNLNKLKTIVFNLENFNLKTVMKYLKIPVLYDDFFYVFLHLLGKSNVFATLEDCPYFVNMLALLLHDLTYISTELNFLYNDHECLWNYRKFIVIHIMKLLYEYHGEVFSYQLKIHNMSSLVNTNILNLRSKDVFDIRNEIPRKVSSTRLYKIVIVNEIEFIETNENTFNISQSNLALRYLRWLKCTNFYDD